MGSKKVSTPPPPVFQPDPNVGIAQTQNLEQYEYLINGLTKPGQSLTGGLGEATQLSPDISRLSMEYAKSQLDPQFRINRQNTMNDLEANNQLTGSTTGSALGNLDADYMASLTGMQAQYGLADVNRALNNRMQLYTDAMNINNNFAATGLSNQEQMNQFALQNYENQVAAAMMGQKSGGGVMGGLVGGLGGAVAGGMMSGFNPVGIAAGGALGAYAGYSSSGGAGIATSATAGLGGYMAGSKYAPTQYTYARGPESVTNTLASNPYSLKSSPYYSQGLGGF